MPTGFTLCTICAVHGRTCCMGTDIYVTLGDVRRIREFTSNPDFYEFRKPIVPSYRDQGDDPPWESLVFRPDGSRRVVKKNVSGACIFLGSGGCLLPISCRPLICRLHPHMYNFQGLYPDISSDCPVNLLPPGSVLETSIEGFLGEDAVNWHHLLYEEIKEKEEDS